MRRSDVTVRVYGCLAIITGKGDFDVTQNGQDSNPHLLFTSIWAKRGPDVQFVVGIDPSSETLGHARVQRAVTMAGIGEASMAVDNESSILKRVAYRFVPFLMLCYFVNYLDRVNVGFAKLTMDKDLGLSDTAFGFGAGIFFLAIFCSRFPRTS